MLISPVLCLSYRCEPGLSPLKAGFTLLMQSSGKYEDIACESLTVTEKLPEKLSELCILLQCGRKGRGCGGERSSGFSSPRSKSRHV